MPRRGLRWATTLAVVATATGLAAVSGVAGTGGGHGTPAPAAFRLEDGSVGCRLEDYDRLVGQAPTK